MGIVEEVGAGIRNLRVGQRVVVPFNISCGECFMCVRGLQSQCETTQVREYGSGAALFGYTKLYGQVPGGQAERLRVPLADYNTIPVGEELPDERYLFLSDILPTAWQGVQYAHVPDGGTLASLVPLAKDPVTATSASYRVADEATTTLEYRTRAGGRTAFAVLPHQADGLTGAGEPVGSYRSIYGTLTLYAGNQLTWTEPLQAARPGLDLSGLSDAERTEVAAAVKADVAAAKPYPADTYFGGKALYRDAQLIQIARRPGRDAHRAGARGAGEVDRPQGLRDPGRVLLLL